MMIDGGERPRLIDHSVNDEGQKFTEKYVFNYFNEMLSIILEQFN